MAKYILQKEAVECAQNEGAFDVALWLENMETVELSENITDVQPVKYGRWLSSDSYITTAYGTIHYQICSECGADLMEDNDYDYNFCPVCGARMGRDAE